MRKLLAAGIVVGVTAAGATAAFATGTPSFKVTPVVSPNKAGTPRHPQGVHLGFNIRWQDLGPADQPVTTKFKIFFPKGSLYNGGRFPKCSTSRLNTASPAGCPRGSIMGSGTGTAHADQTLTHPRITVVNGGANTVLFYTVLNNPARVQQAVIGRLHNASGKYRYELDVSIPRDLQNVAGVPIALTSLSVSAGKGTWLATTGCSHGKWPFQVTSFYDNGTSSTFVGSTRCRR
jgi:hypothetical protein